MNTPDDDIGDGFECDASVRATAAAIASQQPARPKRDPLISGLPPRVWGRPSNLPECDPVLTLDPDEAMEWAHHGYAVGQYRPDGWGDAAEAAPKREAWKPTELQILEAAEQAGLWPNTVRHWLPAFDRFFDALQLAAPAGPLDDFGLPIVYGTEAAPELWTLCQAQGRDEASVHVRQSTQCGLELVFEQGRNRIGLDRKAAAELRDELNRVMPAEAAPKQEAVTVPESPTQALLRPFYNCPPDELELAWAAMVHIARKAAVQPRQPAPADSVKIPASEAEAELTQKLGYAWLQQHAPHRLVPQQPAPEPVAADSKDAARYRWLRDKAPGEIVFDHTELQSSGGSHFMLIVPFDGEPVHNDAHSAVKLDAAIDAMLAAAPQTPAANPTPF